jgi:serine/threonine protein kinase
MKKVVNNEELAQKVMNEMYKEYAIAKDLVHPNIVSYKYFIRKGGDNERANEEEFHIILELLEGGNVKEYIKKEGRLTDIAKIIDWSRQMLKGLEYLHSKSIMHQDLKPQNILFTKGYEQLKLADLGVSNILDKTKATSAANCGTLRYMPPE